MSPKRITVLAALAAILAAVAALSTPAPAPDRQFVNLPDFPKPNGYTHVVTTAPGRMVFVSGQGGRGADGKMPADFTTQADNTFRNLSRCLERGGATFKDVVKINYFLTDLANTEELRRVRARYLNMNAPPAATLVQSGLAGGLLLEVELVAVVPERR
jgi:enamine deaminase RidA (YjgF/YER057c/UK114 family)